MRHLNRLLAAGALAFAFATPVLAQDAEPGNPRDMTPEERHAARDARRADWENMSEEERAAAREARAAGREDHRAARRERFENMTDEQRAAARERIQQRRAEGGGRQGPRRRGGPQGF